MDAAGRRPDNCCDSCRTRVWSRQSAGSGRLARGNRTGQGTDLQRASGDEGTGDGDGGLSIRPGPFSGRDTPHEAGASARRLSKSQRANSWLFALRCKTKNPLVSRGERNEDSQHVPEQQRDGCKERRRGRYMLVGIVVVDDVRGGVENGSAGEEHHGSRKDHAQVKPEHRTSDDYA